MGNYQESSSKTYQSPLAKEQLKILQNRESIFNSYFWPELQSSIEAADVNSPEGAAKMQMQTNAIKQSFASSYNKTNQQLAQQGLLGGANGGVQAALTAANNRARSSALAQAYYNTLSSQQNAKTNLLQIGATLMPSTTQAAPMEQKSNSWGFGIDGKGLAAAAAV